MPPYVLAGNMGDEGEGGLVRCRRLLASATYVGRLCCYQVCWDAIIDWAQSRLIEVKQAGVDGGYLCRKSIEGQSISLLKNNRAHAYVIMHY